MLSIDGTMPRTNAPRLSTRSASFVASTLDVEKRTVQLVWTTGARVMRGYFDRYWEELSLNPKHVRMERLQSGTAPLLDSHDASGIEAVIGIVQSAKLERDRGTAVVRFDSGPRGEDAMRRVGEGTLRGVSVGYATFKMQKVEGGDDATPVYRAIDWEPHELSLTPVGADAGAHVRSHKERSMPKKNPKKSTPGQPPEEIRELVVDEQEDDDQLDEPSQRSLDSVTPEERERCAKIARMTRTLGARMVGSERTELEQLGDQLIREGASVARARARLVDMLAEASPESGGIIPFDKRDARLGGVHIEAGHDHGRRSLELMAEALASRFGGPPPSADARQYVRLSTVDFARHFLEQRGVNTRMLSKNQIIERSIGPGLNSTSDFPALLTETGNRMLRNQYAAYTGGLQRTARQVSAPDFRPITKLQIGEAATLDKVLEGGEYKSSTIGSSKESYALATFGRIFGLTRQAIVNDDLGAFADVSGKFGRAAGEFVASQLAALLVSNPTMATDATALFHANHGNLAAAGAAITVASLGVALKSMRLQKGLDGTTPIDVTPKYLVVPAALETVALQTVAAITPAQTSNVNPFAGKLEVVVDPRLDASSATAWYLAADPAVIDGLEYAYLDGGNGPELFVQEGWRIDGVEWKVRLDFGAGFLDWRSWYKNPGA